MRLLVAVFLYTLQLIPVPVGLSLPKPQATAGASTRPVFAAIARNGTVAVLLAPIGRDVDSTRRLLIVRSNGTTVILRSESVPVQAAPAFRGFITKPTCTAGNNDCPFFANVVLARDGTPFVTLAYVFSGAYSGVDKAAFLWNGAWHEAPRGNPFQGLGKPQAPSNISIAATDTPDRYAFIGDYQNSFPAEDLQLAAADQYYMADLSGAQFGSRNVALGIGGATAIRGRFVVGIDAGLKLVPPRSGPAVAVVWRCPPDERAYSRRCARIELGAGVAYDVDSNGEVVGDNELALPNSGSAELHSTGLPTLWRGRSAMLLSEAQGTAYAISESGTIVGSLARKKSFSAGTSAFVASARDARPGARELDPLVQAIGNLHVQAAFGVADDGRILATVVDKAGKRSLAILIPLHARTRSVRASRRQGRVAALLVPLATCS